VTVEEGEEAQKKARALEGLRRAFRPEFINRIDQIVVFHSLGRDELRRIVDLLLEQSAIRLREQQIELSFGDDLREFLMRVGFDPEFGARPLRRAIQTHVDDTLADAILAGTVQPGQTATITVADDKVTVTASGEPIVRQPANPQLHPQQA
jgi:ATP-dependent Clp protease ATP-binding subunit ClpC